MPPDTWTQFQVPVNEGIYGNVGEYVLFLIGEFYENKYFRVETGY